jgi:uncharacterized protein YidB (DUF937 family)
MTETATLSRLLFDRLTQDGHITLDAWVSFKQSNGVQGHQVEPLLIEVLSHMCTMAGELQAETNRLAAALHKHTG